MFSKTSLAFRLCPRLRWATRLFRNLDLLPSLPLKGERLRVSNKSPSATEETTT
jgi:hypothetical protein